MRPLSISVKRAISVAPRCATKPSIACRCPRAFAGALKKRLGRTIESAKVESRGRVYRIVG